MLYLYSVECNYKRYERAGSIQFLKYGKIQYIYVNCSLLYYTTIIGLPKTTNYSNCTDIHLLKLTSMKKRDQRGLNIDKMYSTSLLNIL